MELLEKYNETNDKEVVFIFRGQMVNEDKMEEIVNAINAKYPTLEVGVIDGKQDVYDLLIGLM